MRIRKAGFSVKSRLRSAPVLGLAILLSGCASKGAQQESSLYPDRSVAAQSRQYARLRPPAPVPAVRGYSRRRGAAAVVQNDEARYSAVYGVPPRPDYLNNPAVETMVPKVDVEPLPRAKPRQMASTARFDYTASASSARRPAYFGERRIVVTRGDTLHNIAWRYKTTITALLRANRLPHGNLEIGQELIIPAKK